MNRPSFARIAVNISQLSGLYDYAIPEPWLVDIQAGSLVTVPFGRQVTQGIIVKLIDTPSVPEPKQIASIIEKKPVLTPSQIKLAEWMAEENLTSLSACLELMLPPGLSKQADILIHLVDSRLVVELSSTQKQIVTLLNQRGDLRGKQLDRSMPHVNWRKSLQGLIKQGIITSQPFLPAPAGKPKTGRAARLKQTPDDDETLKRLGRSGTPSLERRQRALNFLKEEGNAVNVAFVCAESGANSADLKLLFELGLIEFEEIEIIRDPLADVSPALTETLQLTPEQSAVVRHLLLTINGKAEITPTLLQGVTGSGKTEVYLRLVEEALRLGRQAIILVPEISLTPQTVNRFMARFRGKVALMHSKLSPGERYDTWRRIRSGELRVAVGPRSALFAPFDNLGVIVIDECHDGSYHQEDFAPHYNAISTAIAYGQITNSIVLLGSATPEVEQLHQFKAKKWHLFDLPNRVLAHQKLHPLPNTENQTSLPMPDVEVVDMRAELAAGNRSSLSRSLQQGITRALAENHQAILFLNRRGSSTYVFCRDCGYVLKCSRCNTPLTYHENQSVLACHHCNSRRQMPVKCPQCSGTRIKQFGLGTESLEKLVADQFPKARLLRWDADTSKTKGAHDSIMEDFSQHKADILIGTQMLAKGLDLPNVTLVGVILADISLNMPDFRASERTFQLLTQVAGRAGRSALGGKVVLQTFHPDHYAIQHAAAYDFAGFEKTELDNRKQIGYPPFSKIIKIELRHSNPTFLEQSAKNLGDHLSQWLIQDNCSETSLIGPAPCFFQRISGEYRWQILVRGPNPAEFLRTHPLSDWVPSGVKVEITVDPVNIL